LKEIDLILDFSIKLGRQMLMSGADLEHVNATIKRICRCYDLREVSIFSLSSMITVSAKDSDGEISMHQLSVPSFGIQLERLRKLNQLADQIYKAPPEPDDLEALLRWARVAPEYPLPVILLGYVMAVVCLSFLFGGGWRDAVASALTMIVLFWLLRVLSRPGVNKIITNVLSMLTIGTLSLIMVKIGIGQNYATIMIADGLIVIPGIPLVNATRNLLCGNEMNGILEIMKVILETATLVGGLVLSVHLFGGFVS
jgi:uncharacterized membrane protein YjjP (DUF1212 family)